MWAWKGGAIDVGFIDSSAVEFILVHEVLLSNTHRLQAFKELSKSNLLIVYTEEEENPWSELSLTVVTSSNWSALTLADLKKSYQANSTTASKGRILIVDDDRSLLRLVSRALSLSGYEVHTAEDSEETLEMLSTMSEFDVALIDFELPGKNGAELIEMFKTRSPSTVLIGITANFTKERTAEFVHHGALTVLGKPLDLKALNHAMKKLTLRNVDMSGKSKKAGIGRKLKRMLGRWQFLVLIFGVFTPVLLWLLFTGFSIPPATKSEGFVDRLIRIGGSFLNPSNQSKLNKKLE